MSKMESSPTFLPPSQSRAMTTWKIDTAAPSPNVMIHVSKMLSKLVTQPCVQLSGALAGWVSPFNRGPTWCCTAWGKSRSEANGDGSAPAWSSYQALLILAKLPSVCCCAQCPQLTWQPSTLWLQNNSLACSTGGQGQRSSLWSPLLECLANNTPELCCGPKENIDSAT